MRVPTLAAALLMAGGCATQPENPSAQPASFTGPNRPPEYAPLVNDAVAEYHHCLGYTMQGFLESGGNAQEMIDATIQRCEVQLRRLDGELFARDVAAEERRTVIDEAEAEARDMLQRHLQEVLAEQS